MDLDETEEVVVVEEKEKEEQEVKEPPPYASASSPALIPAHPGENEDEPPPYTVAGEVEVEMTNTDGGSNDFLPPSYEIIVNDVNVNVNINVMDEKRKNKNKKDDVDVDDGDEKDEENEPILHFLDHQSDTIQSLSLRYNIPAQLLRSFNRLGSDHLLVGRQTILIPRGEHHDNNRNKMKSLSPCPVPSEQESIRKSKIRRWMVTVKCPDYDVALLYLEQASYDLDAATDNYFADEAWERDHPFVPSSSSLGRRRDAGGKTRSGGGNGYQNENGGGSASASVVENGTGNSTKIRDYHRQRLSGKIPQSLLQPSTNW